MSRRRNDWIRTGAAMPSLVLRLGLVLFVAIASLILVPVTGWQAAAVIAVALGVFIPQSFGGWIAIACIVVGILINEPSIWRAMVAVLVVHIGHVVSSLLLAIPFRSRVVLAALRPTLRRVLLVQLITQPLTLVVMLTIGYMGDTSVTLVVMEVAPIIGAGALAVFAILFLTRIKRVDRRS